MKDRTLLLSLVLAGAMHALALAFDFPAVRPAQVVLPPVMEVALFAAPRVDAKQDAAPAPAVRERPIVQARPKAVVRVAPKKKEIAPAPDPQPIQPEPVEQPVAEAPAEELPAIFEDPSASQPSLASVDVPVPSVGSPIGSADSTADYSPGTTGAANSDSTGGIVDTMPAYSYNPKPRYPRSARQAGQQGTAVLRVEVLSSGRAGRIIVEKSTGYDLLDAAAVEAVKRWKFTPAEKGKQRVTSWVKIPIEFSLRETP